MKKVTLLVTLILYAFFAMELVEGEMFENPMNEQRAAKLKPQISGILIRQFNNHTTNGNEGPKIIGESPASENQFPWMAALVAGETFQCGGAVISRGYVLTAAHCIKPADVYTVYLGTVDWTDENSRATFEVANTMVHPNFDAIELTNDICIILLDPIISLSLINSGRVASIRLPKRSQANKAFKGVLGTVSGWGPTEDGGDVSSTLNYVDLKIIKNSACSKFWGPRPSTNLCTSAAKSKNVCGVDSGSPLVVRESGLGRTLVGIVSYVADSCYGTPAVYTRTSKYLSWIFAKTGIKIRP